MVNPTSRHSLALTLVTAPVCFRRTVIPIVGVTTENSSCKRCEVASQRCSVSRLQPSDACRRVANAGAAIGNRSGKPKTL